MGLFSNWRTGRSHSLGHAGAMTGLALALSFAGCAVDSDAQPDAAPVDNVDAAPSGLPYPSGPYGSGPEDVMRNHQWVGWVDNNGDGDQYNDGVRLFELGEYHTATDPDAKIIMLSAAAGWCGPCRAEANGSSRMMSDYGSRGVRFATAIFEDDGGAPVDRDYVKQWGETFNLAYTTLVDSTFQMGRYFDENAMPMNMFVDARDMKIIVVTNGFDEQSFRDILDYYLSRP